MPAKRDLDPGASPLHFFGAEVRRAREAAGMTLADLGAVVPCDASTVSKIEAGQLRPTQRFVTACIETCPQLEWLGRFHEDSQLWGDGAIPRWFEDWLKAERAVRTMISAPCSTVWVPWNMFRPVAVYPSSTALTRICGNALAYWMVSMFTAAFDAGWATPGYAAAGEPGVVIRAIEPSPLLTFTMTGAADRSSSGRNACVTRTTPKTFVSKIARIASQVSSPAPNTPPSALRPSIPALLTSTSRPPRA